MAELQVNTVPPAIQDDVNNLSLKIGAMKTAIQEVRDARKKLHDDTSAWVQNNIRKALETVSEAQAEIKQDTAGAPANVLAT